MSLINRVPHEPYKFVRSYAHGEAKVVDHPRHFGSKNPSCGKHKDNGNLIQHDHTHYDCNVDGFSTHRRIPMQRPTAPALGFGSDSAAPDEINIGFGKRIFYIPPKRPAGYGKRTNMDINKTTMPNKSIKGRKVLWYMIGGGGSHIFDENGEEEKYHSLIRSEGRKNFLSPDFARMDCTGGKGDFNTPYRPGKGVTHPSESLVGVMAPDPICRGKPFSFNPPYAVDN
eukprot:Tbor_TRINITY_DN1792_c0_g1::TRINITY_DN1792_c0_g1_i1::g.21303::m.21303